MSDVTAERFIAMEEGGYAEVDTLLSVEVADPEAKRGINLHVSPRQEDVVTCSLSAEEAWRLARDLARAASEVEIENG